MLAVWAFWLGVGDLCPAPGLPKICPLLLSQLWDTPAQAFRYGMGYCAQYNLALKLLLDRLGIATQAVTSIKVRVADDPTWSMGHTWLRVTVQGDARAVCAGHADNLPGQVNFTAVAPVWPVGVPVLFLLHLGMIPFLGYCPTFALSPGLQALFMVSGGAFWMIWHLLTARILFRGLRE